MYEQLKNYFNKILSKYQYRFKKGLLGMEVVVVEGGRGGDCSSYSFDWPL